MSKLRCDPESLIRGEKRRLARAPLGRSRDETHSRSGSEDDDSLIGDLEDEVRSVFQSRASYWPFSNPPTFSFVTFKADSKAANVTAPVP